MLSPLLFAASVLLALVEATARTSPPSGAIVVAKSGGSYTTLQAAVNSISTSSTTARVIFIQPGTYNEQVLIPVLAGKLTIYGYTTNDQDYSLNQVTITQSKGADTAGSNDASGTLRVKSSGVSVYNLNVINSRGSGIQAIALSAYAPTAGNQAYYGCKFIGYQDTILANTGRQLYSKCYIEGATDFIFGQTALAWFEKGTIAISGKGYITANGRDSSSNPSYYVLNNVNVVTKSGVSLAAGSTYLGRPWRNYSRVVVQNSALGAVVNSAGWVQWNSGDPRTDNVFYREYGNTGTGASGTRASFSSKLSSAVTFAGVMGTNSWVDMTYWNGGSTSSTTSVAVSPNPILTITRTSTSTGVRVTTSSLKTTSVAVTTSSARSGSGCAVDKNGQYGRSAWTGCTLCTASVCTFSKW